MNRELKHMWAPQNKPASIETTSIIAVCLHQATRLAGSFQVGLILVGKELVGIDLGMDVLNIRSKHASWFANPPGADTILELERFVLHISCKLDEDSTFASYLIQSRWVWPPDQISRETIPVSNIVRVEAASFGRRWVWELVTPDFWHLGCVEYRLCCPCHHLL